jgi:hypothetical protein
MSYEKIKSIKIDEKEKKVFITSACNNVRPLTYDKWECSPLSEILRQKGKTAVKIAILKDYETGDFQEGNNEYTRALKVLRYILKEEYKPFNWNLRKWGDEKATQEQEELRKSKDFDDLLLKALCYKIPKEKYIITKEHFGEVVFGKRCLTCMKWERDKSKATKYDFEQEAKDNIFNDYKDIWKVEVLE